MFCKGKLLSLSLALILMVTIMSGTSANAIVAEEFDITLRIEGISENVFYEKVTVEFVDELTVKEFFEYVNEQNPDLNITGLDVGFISEVKGEASSYFGGWDGWYYLVNSVAPSVGVSDYVLSDNDSVVLYYSDMATQRPIVDLSDIANGNIKFTSADVTYDDDWNEIININSVAGATVTVQNYDNTFITDSNGVINVGEIPKGEYSLSIEKYDEQNVDGKYLPLVLRFAPDFTIKVDDNYSLENEVTEPGDTSVIHFAILAFLSIILVFVSLKNRTNREY